MSQRTHPSNEYFSVSRTSFNRPEKSYPRYPVHDGIFNVWPHRWSCVFESIISLIGIFNEENKSQMVSFIRQAPSERLIY